MSIAAVIAIPMLSSCASNDVCGFHAFTEKRDWVNYAAVAKQKAHIFSLNEECAPFCFPELANRIDYLEAYGVSVNAAIGAESEAD